MAKKSPPLKISAQDRKDVAVLKAWGNSAESIALGLGISEEALKASCAHELTVGAQHEDKKVILGAHAKAIAGVASVVNLYLQRREKVAIAEAEAAFKELPADTTAAKLGKKELADIATAEAAEKLRQDGLLH